MPDGDQFDPTTMSPLGIGGQVHPLILQALARRFGNAVQGTMAGAQQAVAPIAGLAESIVRGPRENWDRGYAGDIPTPQEQIPWAANTATTLMGASTPFAEPGAAGIFGGRLAKTANLPKLERAQQMMASGATPDEIWKQTGWFQGADQQWRFEIPDVGAKLAPQGSVWGYARGRSSTLGQELKHPALYEAYPQLAEMPTQRGYRFGDTTVLAGYAPTWATNPKGPQLLFGPKANTRTALHETQHAIQDIEGFASGGGETELRQSSPAWGIYQDYLDRIPKMNEMSNEEMSRFIGMRDRVLTDRERQNVLDNIASKPQAWRENMARNMAMANYYRHLAGEVEARNVETRYPFGILRRQITPPWQTADVPGESQFVRTNLDRARELGYGVQGELPLDKSIRTYHASPYDFGSFDMSKVGTGQGAQAYGHGIYSAEAPEVAGEYLREFQGKNPALPQGRTYELELHGEPHEYLDWDRPIAEQPEMYKRLMTIPGLAKRRVTVDGLALGEHPDTQFIEPEVLNYFNRAMTSGRSNANDVLDWMDNLPRIQRGGVRNPIDWRRNVDALRDVVGRSEVGTENFIPSHWHGAAIARGWEDINPATAASVMNRAGIRGVRYLDQESRETELRRDQLNDLIDAAKNATNKQTGQRLMQKYQTELESLPKPTRNYVSFSDKLIDILKKYGWAGVLGGGVGSQMMQGAVPKQSMQGGARMGLLDMPVTVGGIRG